MNKFDKLQVAAILLDIDSLFNQNPSNNIASSAAILSSDISKDGLDSKDLAKMVLNESFDINPAGIIHKIQNNILLNYDVLKKEFQSRGDGFGLSALESIKTNNPDIETLKNSLANLLKGFNKHNSGGEINFDDDVVITTIGNKTYRLIVFKTELEKREGLMNVDELDADEGALFDYRDNVMPKISFWMKNTSIPLDIIFVGKDNVVISVQQGEPQSEDILSEQNVAYVIEVNQNSGIKSGDVVKFKEDKSNDKSGVLEIIGSDGEVQAVLQGTERIFSIKNSRTLVSMAKRAYESKLDSDYKALGKKIFEYMKIQNERPEEYVE